MMSDDINHLTNYSLQGQISDDLSHLTNYSLQGQMSDDLSHLTNYSLQGQMSDDLSHLTNYSLQGQMMSDDLSHLTNYSLQGPMMSDNLSHLTNYSLQGQWWVTTLAKPNKLLSFSQPRASHLLLLQWMLFTDWSVRTVKTKVLRHIVACHLYTTHLTPVTANWKLRVIPGKLWPFEGTETTLQ